MPRMPKASEWLRITLFGSPAPDPSQAPVDAWWRQVTGVEPEQTLRNRAKGQATAIGDFDGNRLAVTAEVMRVDWQIAPAAVSPESPVFSFPAVGMWPDTAASFLGRLSPWLSEYPAKRLAIGTVVVQTTESKASGYAALEYALRDFGIRLPKDTSDFMLQANAVTTSAVEPGLQINRLAKWSVAMVAPIWMEFTVAPGTVASVSQANTITGEGQSFVRAEIDFNTAGDRTEPFTVDVARGLFDELRRLGEAYIDDRMK